MPDNSAACSRSPPRRLGFKCRIYSDVPGPASDVAVSTTIGAYEDLAKIAKFAEETEVVTYEFENVPVEAATAVERVRPVRPGLKALEAAQDRYREKCFIACFGHTHRALCVGLGPR